MNKTLKITSNPYRITMVVKLIEKGDKWGLRDMLTYDEEDPMVEFNTEYGGYISRYYLSTFTKDNEGIWLEGSDETLTIDGENKKEIVEWINSVTKKKDNGEPKKLQELNKFTEIVHKLGEKMLEESEDYAEERVNTPPEKVMITISIKGNNIEIPLTATSYDGIVELLEEEKEYVEKGY